MKTLSGQEAIYAYNFEGKRYDVGDKLGFLQATVDFALKKECIGKEFMDFLKMTVDQNKEYNSEIFDEFEIVNKVAATID